MSQEFTVFMDYLNKLEKRYSFMLSAFYTWEALIELCAPNIVGKKEARQNVEIMNRSNKFFGPSKESLRVYFLLELAKLFDASDQSLHIDRVINFTESNIQKLLVSDFAEFNQNRGFIEELVKNYKGINIKDLKHVRSLIALHTATIQDLKTYRDKYLAHDDISKVDVTLKQYKIKALFKVIEEILNLFSYKGNHSTRMYNSIEKECKNDTKMVLEYLRRFEPYRLKEINIKHGLE